MMSLETIRRLSQDVAKCAAREGRRPLLIEQEDLPYVADLIWHIPNLGSYVPRGFTLTRRLFVDKTGWGADNEPALTFAQFCREITADRAYAIIEEGEFQVYVGEFIMTKIARDGATRIARSALREKAARRAASPAEALRTATVRVLKHDDLRKCRFAILVPEHYRDDGSCKCDDLAHRAFMVREWGYSTKDFEGIPLRSV